MQWEKNKISLQDGTEIDAQVPVIISASRATDIPAFYSDWFIKRWQAGYVKWKNPFNGQSLYVSFKKTRVVVFWTKNPKAMLKHLDYLNKNIPNYYFQYSLNDYVAEGFEAKIASLDSRIKTFKELSNKLGKKKVIWRFDPLLLTDTIDINELLSRVKKIGDQLNDYTEKLVFSFADIATYRKVSNNLKNGHINYEEFTAKTMDNFAKGLYEINKDWGLQLATCCEEINLEKYGISHNKCIDDDLMVDMFSNDTKLMEFLGIRIDPPTLFEGEQIVKKRNLKDKGQRADCGCIMAKDIGQYNTCPHECIYCYANTSKKAAKNNYENYLKNNNCESIVGGINGIFF